MNKRKFTWDCLCIDDTYVNSYVVSKDVCREKRAVIGYIVAEDCLNNIPNVDINPKAEIKDGWCRYCCGWYDGERASGYVAEVGQEKPNYGKGWFPVWIVRADDICKEMCSMNGDLISRQDAIAKFKKTCTYESIDKNGIKRGEIHSAMTYEKIIKIIESLPSAEPERKKGRKFLGIVVNYPKICTYPEYEGKPYYSIKYEENGDMIVGYGTYKPEVLSQYLREYFISPTEPERKTGRWVLWNEPGCEYAKCTACGEMYDQDDLYIGGNDYPKFCPYCGAEME